MKENLTEKSMNYTFNKKINELQKNLQQNLTQLSTTNIKSYIPKKFTPTI